MEESIELADGRIHRLQLTSSQAQQIIFSNIEGTVSLTTTWEEPLTLANNTNSNNFELQRKYTLNGKELNDGDTIPRGSLVRVELQYNFGPQSFGGCYQVIEHIPSGLRPIAKLYQRGITETNVRYPYFMDDSVVKYCLTKGYQPHAVYYARVISPGIYYAEGALMQSQRVLGETFLTPRRHFTIE